MPLSDSTSIKWTLDNFRIWFNFLHFPHNTLSSGGPCFPSLFGLYYLSLAITDCLWVKNSIMMLLRILYQVTFALCAVTFLSGKCALPTRVWILIVLCPPPTPQKAYPQKLGFLGDIPGRLNLGEILDLWRYVLKGDCGTMALVPS